MRIYPTLWLVLTLAGVVQGQRFEVAVIKPYGAGPKGVFPRENGHFSATGMTLRTLVEAAYQRWPYEVQGQPRWTHEELFAIEAKAESAGPVTREQHFSMLRDLLSTRFKLRVHWETREMDAYALTVDRAGHKLMPASPGGFLTENIARAGSRNSGGLQKNTDDAAEQMQFRMSVRGFASRLQFWIGTYEYSSLPVVDRTGLEGTYEVRLPWAREMTRYDSDPSIFTVIGEAGLRLEKRKVPVEVLVFEADRPELE